MGLSTTMMAADLAFMTNDLPQAITIDGQSVNVIAGEYIDQDRLEQAGFVGDSGFMFLVAASTFSAYAVKNKRVTVTATGKVYRIEHLALSPDGVSYQVWCVDDVK